MIYLDTAATTKPNSKVINAMMPYFKEEWYNPSSLYSPSQSVKEAIDEAKQNVADYLHAKPEEIYFTSGGSESNCWVIQGFINDCCYNHNKIPVIITSDIEHKSILECVKHIAPYCNVISVDKKGFIDTSELECILKKNSECIDDKAILVSIQFANNEIGTIQNIKEIASLVHKYGGIFHTDAVQAFGHIEINIRELGIDMLSASGHKIGTPKGIGILFKKSNISISPLIYGTQMDGMRGGTENVPYIVGFGEAIKLCHIKLIKEGIANHNKTTVLRDYMISKLQKTFGCQVNGSLIKRLSNNINVTFKENITGEALIYLLDMCGIYISAGSACNSHSTVPSHVLKAIGLTDEEAMKTIRITLPDDITFAQIDNVIYEIEKQIKLLTINNKEGND